SIPILSRGLRPHPFVPRVPWAMRRGQLSCFVDSLCSDSPRAVSHDLSAREWQTRYTGVPSGATSRVQMILGFDPLVTATVIVVLTYALVISDRFDRSLLAL